MNALKRTTVSRAVGWSILVVVAGLAAAAFAQPGGGPAAPPRERPRLEYLQQEVQAEAIVQTLNDLDAQGWDLFQVIPAWTFSNANGEATLVARSYHVIGRGPLKPEQ